MCFKMFFQQHLAGNVPKFLLFPLQVLFLQFSVGSNVSVSIYIYIYIYIYNDDVVEKYRNFLDVDDQEENIPDHWPSFGGDDDG